MQTVRSVVLQHLRLRAAPAIAARGGSGRPALYGFTRGLSAPAGQEDSKGSNSSDPERDIRTRVVNLVKKFDKIDADKSNQMASFLPYSNTTHYILRLLEANPNNLVRHSVDTFRRATIKEVTETADFQKDLSLDSLDRVELVMAFEQEFSIEIPDDKADKLTCCADVAKHIISESQISDKSAGGS